MNQLNPYNSTLLPPASSLMSIDTLRVATYNIHKGVRGIGPRRRLEIHNLGLAVEALDADLVFLQEVRLFHERHARQFDRTHLGWPNQGQAEFLAPEGYDVAYRTNAVTRHGEHGNALLSRWPIGDIGHHDVSDHRFEQRGLLHVPVAWNGVAVHAVVAHFGPVLAGGRLIVASSDGLIRAFDPASGALAGSVELPGGAASAPAVAGGVLYVVTKDGKLRAFR